MGCCARYYFRNAEEIYDLARYLAEELPNSHAVMIGIYELLLNAVEHGNLGMDREAKSALLRQGTFGKEINKRLSLPENKIKYVEVEWEKDECFTRLSIRDQGKGFDWRQQMTPETPNRSIHGRGLLIAEQCGFDAVTFNEHGNAATCFTYDPATISPNRCDYNANAPACDKIQCPKSLAKQSISVS